MTVAWKLGLGHAEIKYFFTSISGNIPVASFITMSIEIVEKDKLAGLNLLKSLVIALLLLLFSMILQCILK